MKTRLLFTTRITVHMSPKRNRVQVWILLKRRLQDPMTRKNSLPARSISSHFQMPKSRSSEKGWVYLSRLLVKISHWDSIILHSKCKTIIYSRFKMGIKVIPDCWALVKMRSLPWISNRSKKEEATAQQTSKCMAKTSKRSPLPTSLTLPTTLTIQKHQLLLKIRAWRLRMRIILRLFQGRSSTKEDNEHPLRRYRDIDTPTLSRSIAKRIWSIKLWRDITRKRLVRIHLILVLTSSMPTDLRVLHTRRIQLAAILAYT